MSAPNVITRQLASRLLGRSQVLDVVRDAKGAVTCIFARGTAPDDASAAFGGALLPPDSLTGSPIVCVRETDIGGKISDSEPDLLAGRNVSVATRNGEPAERVLDWLNYHFDRFGMDGAVIFERAPAGTENAFWNDVNERLALAGKPIRVVVVAADVPLGNPDLPPEAHQFCVPEAPGRDRMDVPAPDAWRAPLHEMTIYEIARIRFLTKARAIANIDLHDLLIATPEVANPFDLAVEAPGRYVELIGQHCYPWRVRKGGMPGFGDHICVQFDKPRFRRRWCVAPSGLSPSARLKCLRISHTKPAHEARFYRFMAIRHPSNQSSLIVPKASLIEHRELVDLASAAFDVKPVRPPEISVTRQASDENRTTIVTTMKNEGPFIMEWLAYHRAIGVRDFLVYTNDCTDGTDTFFDLLQAKGLVQHRDNPFRELNLKPQHAALQMAEGEKVIQNADWVICMDVDEFINVKVGDGRLDDLYRAVGDANMISCTWRLFGNSDVRDYRDDFTIAMFDRCAEEFSPKPHQAWGFKTLFRNVGIFKKLGVHRPKGLRPQLWDQILWVNGSGKPLPRHEFRNAWRSTVETYGYDLVSLNHYAVRNAESFLVKRDRGRVNHVDRDQGLAYWFRMNNNSTTDQSIQRRIPLMQAEFDKLMSDPEIADQHRKCVEAHQAKIAQLKSDNAQMTFFGELTGERMERLSRMHKHFGANVFLSGPQSVPDNVVWGEHPENFFFTVERGETQH